MVCHCRMVNCGPSKCCVPPVLAPAEGLVRAGAVLRGGGIRDWGRGGLPSFTPGLAVLLRCFAVGSRLSFFLCQEKRDSLRYLAFLFRRGSRSPFVRSRGALRLSAFVGSLRVWLFLYGDLDGVTTGVGYTKRNAVFVQRSFCYRFMIRNDTAGSPLGLRAPNLRQRVFDSLDSLHWIRGVGTFYAVRASVNPWL